MSIEELLARESIRNTLASYTMAGDRLQSDKFVSVFTDDAVLETDGVPEPDAFRYEGRAAIHAWINRWRGAGSEDQQATHQATFVRHHLATSLIEFTAAESARVRTYWTAYTDIGPDHCGVYVDLMKRIGEEWLIAHRRIRLDWRSTNSLMFTAIARTS